MLLCDEVLFLFLILNKNGVLEMECCVVLIVGFLVGLCVIECLMCNW